MRLILYSKPGCHLCEGLEEKLKQVRNPDIELEVRDITQREDWFAAYEYEVPVIFQQVGDREKPIPRPSPRASIGQLEKTLQKYFITEEL